MVWFAAFIAVIISGGIYFNTQSVAGGVENGRLAPCPDKPNCVSSQAIDSKHSIEPFKPVGLEPMDQLARVLKEMPRVNIVKETPVYLHVTFRSKIFRFVDDVEFLYIPEEQVIHVRSASRVGYNDFGVNRDRVEKIRRILIL